MKKVKVALLNALEIESQEMLTLFMKVFYSCDAQNLSEGKRAWDGDSDYLLEILSKF